MRKTYLRGDRVALMTAVKRGESVREAAGRLGVGLSTAYEWVREDVPTRAASRSPTFVELVSAGVPAAGLIVRIGVVEIEVHPGFDAVLLRAVVDALAVAA